MSDASLNIRRKIAFILLRFEALIVLFLGLILIYKGLTSSSAIDWFIISGILGLVIIGGSGLLLAAKGIRDQKMYGRAPAILANLIAVGVSKYMFEAGLWWFAIPSTLIAALIIYCTITLIPKSIPN